VILLQEIDVFDQVPTEQLAYLAAISREVGFEADEVIYTENDRADALYLVLEGEVSLRRSEEEIARSSKQEAFGTWALFSEEPRVVTATALTDTRLLRIGRDDFVDLLSDNVQITQGVLKTMVDRVRSLVQRVDRTTGRARNDQRPG